MDLNAQMKNQLQSLNSKPSLCLHVCCAPCASAVLEKLKNFFNITLYYYNPNIMPEAEWQKRKYEFEKLKAICNFEFVAPSYDNEEFLTFAKGKEFESEGGARCALCIKNRIEKTFDYAHKNGFDYFCSTLSISPHKNAILINTIGEKLQTDKTKWLYNDFKKENGFLRSTLLCKELGVYRQTYCGCKF